MNRVLLTLLLLASALLRPAFAQTGPPVESIVVTGAYVPVTLADFTSAVTILDAQALRALNKRSVADALRAVPGVLIEEQGGQGGLTAVSIRGGEANFTLVLVDGVQLNDPTNTRGGSFDFSNLDIAHVERIEIVRGPQSAFYGSDALAGVINIITTAATRGHHQHAAAEIGYDGYRNYRAGASGSTPSLAYSLRLSHRRSDNGLAGSARDNDSGHLMLQWTGTPAHELMLNARRLDGDRTSFPEQSGGPLFAVGRVLDRSRYTDDTLALNWRWQIRSDWQSNVRLTRMDHDEQYTSPGIFPFAEVPPQRATTHFTRDRLQLVNSFRFGQPVRVDVGVDYQKESGDSQGSLEFGPVVLPTNFALDRATLGLFVATQARVQPALLLEASVRRDDADVASAQTSVKLGATYTLPNAIEIVSNWGEAFKLPSFFALGHPLVGNPDLVAETATSWDLGVRWPLTDKLVLSTSYFDNTYRDLIDFDAATFRNVNRNLVETSGLELQAKWTPNPQVLVTGQATYTDIDAKDAATPLTGRPQWKASLTTLWQLAPAWRAAIDYQWTGEEYAGSRHSGALVTERLGERHRVDINLSWQPLPHLSLKLAVDNVLNERYQNAVGFPAAGRGARLAVAVER